MDVLEPLPNPVQHFNQEEDEDEYGNNEASGQVTRSRRDFLSSPTTHSCEMSDTEDLCNNSMTFFDTEEDFLTKRHLIVNYLPQTFTDAELYNTFSPFGPLDSVRIMKDSEVRKNYMTKVKILLVSCCMYVCFISDWILFWIWFRQLYYR